MKRIIPLILILVILVLCLAGCTDEKGKYELREDMSAEDFFEMLKRADSFSVSVGENDYRFVKNEGYSVFETADGGGKIYDGFFKEGNTVYTIKASPDGGLSKTYREFKDKDTEKILEMYLTYVEYVRSSYGTVTKDGEEVAVEIKNNEALVKTIYRPREGYLEIKQCRVYGINNSEIYIPKAYSDYKESSVYESLS